jgi:hypothetical protein
MDGNGQVEIIWCHCDAGRKFWIGMGVNRAWALLCLPSRVLIMAAALAVLLVPAVLRLCLVFKY